MSSQAPSFFSFITQDTSLGCLDGGGAEQEGLQMDGQEWCSSWRTPLRHGVSDSFRRSASVDVVSSG